MSLVLFSLGPITFTVAHAFLVVGAILVIMEAFAPGANMVVFGTGLLVAGLVGVLTGLGMEQGQYDIFILSIIAVIAGLLTFFGYRSFLEKFKSDKLTTSSSEDLQGKQGVVLKTVTPESGQVRIRGVGSNPEYQARSEAGEIDPDTRVEVIDPGGGSILTVRAVEK